MMKQRTTRIMIGLTAATTGFSALTFGQAAQDQGLSITGRPGQEDAVRNTGVAGAGVNREQTLLATIENFINILLGLLSFIVLVLLLYGGFLMVTAAGDDGRYGKGFTILRQAAIGIIVIGISFLIVRFIFQFLNTGTQTQEGGAV